MCLSTIGQIDFLINEKNYHTPCRIVYHFTLELLMQLAIFQAQNLYIYVYGSSNKVGEKLWVNGVDILTSNFILLNIEDNF